MSSPATLVFRSLSMVVCTLTLGLSAQAVTITVNSTNDPAGYNSGITIAQLGSTVTLRDAVNAARNYTGGDTQVIIAFDPGLAGQTIYLEQVQGLGMIETSRQAPDLRIVPIIFQGLTNSPGVTIAKSFFAPQSRMFFCSDLVGRSVTFNHLTFRDANNGTAAGNWGGAFFIGMSVTFNNCAILNSQAGLGGGIYLAAGDTSLTMNNCVVAGNFAGSGGGGIWMNGGQIALNHVTMSGNGAGQTGGGLSGPSSGIGFPPVVRNSIIANNSATLGFADIGIPLSSSSSNNLSSSVPFIGGGGNNGVGNMVNGVNGNIIGVSPQLGALGNYGGPTPTFPLLDNSPAIDAGALLSLPTDQRGIARPQGGLTDMGSFEALRPAPATLVTNAFTRLVNDPAFDLLAAIGPSPTGGTLSGPGISSTNFNPASAGVGVHTILYRIDGQPASPDGITWSTTPITITVNEAPSLIVTTTSDTTSIQDNQTSLREALAYAATLAGTQTITFASALTASGPATLTLTRNGITNALGVSAFRITNAITVQGPSSSNGITLVASGGADRRHFYVEPGASLSLANLTLTGGRTVGQPGGSIVSLGRLTINGCTFTGNSASGVNIDGGAIATGSDVGTLFFVQNSTFASNSASRRGGAIFNGARSNTLIHVTVVDNTGESAVWHFETPVTVINSIIARNFNGTTPADFVTGGSGSLSPQSANNLIGTAASNLFLGTLGNNGGPTPTVAPLPRSPARDAGIVVSGVTTDQTGGPRANGSAPDIGAYELPALVESLVVTITTDEDDGTSDTAYGAGTSLREAVAYAATLTNAPAITFASALTESGPATISLSLTGFTNQFGTSALGISNAVTIAGPSGSNGITLACGGAVAGLRHAFVQEGASLSVSNLTFTGGATTDRGAAIASSGSLDIYGCTFTGNGSTLEGGAVHALGGALSLQIRNSTFANNSAASFGGALVSGAASNLLVNVTMVDNTCGPGGGAYWQFETPATMINSIIARNFSGTDASDIATFGAGNFTAQSANNIIGPGGAANLVDGVNGNRVGVTDPGINPLAHNGGPTRTMTLRSDSPAVNAGVVVAGLTTDQRGVARPQNSLVDIGAVETLITSAASTMGSLTLGLDGAASGSFTSIPGVGFTVFADTNLFTPLHLWSNLGPATETPPGSGLYRFTAPANTNTPYQFFRTQSP